jgi:hypothetical protein
MMKVLFAEIHQIRGRSRARALFTSPTHLNHSRLNLYKNDLSVEKIQLSDLTYFDHGRLQGCVRACPPPCWDPYVSNRDRFTSCVIFNGMNKKAARDTYVSAPLSMALAFDPCATLGTRARLG